jgi:hypothetical protein
VEMIQFRYCQPLDGPQCGLTRVEENAHEPADGGRETWQWLDAI